MSRRKKQRHQPMFSEIGGDPAWNTEGLPLFAALRPVTIERRDGLYVFAATTHPTLQAALAAARAEGVAVAAKAITLRQPWAGLVVSGRKRHEYRSRHVHYTGVLAIHAGQQRDGDSPTGLEALCDPTGAIIGAVWCAGSVDIADLPDEERRAAMGFLAEHNMEHLRVAWRLEDATPLEPVPARGNVTLWNVEL